MTYEDPYKDIEDLEELEIKKEPPPLWKRVLYNSLKVIIGLAVIAGLIYWSGPRKFFFYRKTPDVQVERMESVLQAEQIEVPISAKIIKADDSSKGSERGKEEITSLTEKTNKIWAQADLELKVKSVEEISMNEEELSKFSESPSDFLKELESFESGSVNVFFIGNLEGPSGIAYTGTGNILVADYTTAHDYLVFAHEVGHVLGLDHVDGHNKLMSSEASGAHLSEQEIRTARGRAENIVE